MSSERQAFNDGFDRGFAKASKYIDELEARIVNLVADNVARSGIEEVLKTENNALSELLSPLVDVELERDRLRTENEALMEYVPEHVKREWEHYRAVLTKEPCS